jgi:hypothetical protein
MLVVDLVERVLRAAPEAGVGGGFVALVNDLVNEIWEGYRWPYYVAELSMGPSLLFDNLTVTNGGSSATVVDGDAGGLLDGLHAGKRMTIEGAGYTVASVTDANTLVLSGLSLDTGAGLGGSLPRVVFPLPSDFGRLYGRPYPSSASASLLHEAEEVYWLLEDPRDYVLRGPVSGVYTMELRVLLLEAYTVRYVRRPTAAVGPGSTVDVDGPLEKALFQGVLGHALQRVDARNEVHLAQLQQRIRRADGMYASYLKEAKAVAGSVGEGVRRNRAWGF